MRCVLSVRCCSLVRPQRSRSSQLYGRVPYNWDAYNRILTVYRDLNLGCAGSYLPFFSTKLLAILPVHWGPQSLRAGIKFTGCIEICFANINKEAELGYAAGLFDG